MTFGTVVLAGGRLDGPLAQHASCKALLPVGGRPLLATVLEALRGCPAVGEVLVVSGEEARPLAAGVGWVESGGEGWENAFRGLAALSGPGPCLLCACDLPFATPEAFGALLGACDPEVGLSYPLVSREAMAARFPGSSRRFVPMREGRVTGSSAMLVRPAELLRVRDTVREVFARRKNTLWIAAMLGPLFLLRRLTGTLTFALAEQRVRALTGLDCRAVPGSPPELAFDVDTPADYDYAQNMVGCPA